MSAKLKTAQCSKPVARRRLAPRSSSTHIVATYHYIREHASEGVTGLTPREFRDQIVAIQSRYRIVSAAQFAAWRAEERGLALITFDDAVRDQYLAAGILADLDVPAVFFAPMRPFSDEPDRWCSQHLLHALADELGWRELQMRIEPHLAGVEIDTARMNQLYHYEVPHKRRLKFAMAFARSRGQARDILREINASVGLQAGDWFMSVQQLRQLQDAGHCLGGHGFDHVPYTSLSPMEQAADMHRAMQTMTRLFGPMPRPLAFPFGRADSHTLALARSCGYTMTFGTDDRVDAKFLMEELAQRDAERDR